MAVTNSHSTSRLTQRIRKPFDLIIVLEQAFVHHVRETGDTETFAARVPLVIPSMQKQNSFLPPTEVYFYTLFISVL
jgi:hypothetical protein